MKKKKDLQPWLDYFRMLVKYEKQGYLEVSVNLHEAFVTRAALHAMSEGDDPRQQLLKAIPETACRIRNYVAWKSRQGKDYLKKDFAIHVVKEEAPHDMLYTIWIEHGRSWRSLWLFKDKIEVIDYTDKKD